MSRLLFLVNSLGVGGAEKQVVTLLNHLDAERFRLHLAYLKRDEALLPQLRRERLEEIACLDVPRGIDTGAVRRLRALILARRIDAVVCTNSYSMLYGHLARGAYAGARLAAVFHTTLLRSYKEKAQMLLYRRLFNRCDLLLYVCESQRRYWREHGLRPAADGVVYNGIDTGWYAERRSAAEQLAFRRGLGLSDSDFVIGLCSALRPEKAHGDLLSAVARLRARGVPAKALLIGEGPERPAIERAIDRLGLRGQVCLTGLRQDVRPFVSACDVMTLVSHAIETFSLAALESMSLGKPLVMSDLGGARELLDHGGEGFLYAPGDIEALAGHLTALTSGPLRARLGEAAARRVRQRFTAQTMTARFTDRMEELLWGAGLSAPGPGSGEACPLSGVRRVKREAALHDPS